MGRLDITRPLRRLDLADYTPRGSTAQKSGSLQADRLPDEEVDPITAQHCGRRSRPVADYIGVNVDKLKRQEIEGDPAFR
jgi:hypothetical protein